MYKILQLAPIHSPVPHIAHTLIPLHKIMQLAPISFLSCPRCPWTNLSLVTRTTATTLPRHELSKSRLKVFIFNHKFECLRKTVANALFNQNCHTDMEFMFFNIWFGLFIQNKTRRGKKGKIVALLWVTPPMGATYSATHSSATILDCAKIVAVVCVTAIKWGQYIAFSY